MNKKQKDFNIGARLNDGRHQCVHTDFLYIPLFVDFPFFSRLAFLLLLFLFFFALPVYIIWPSALINVGNVIDYQTTFKVIRIIQYFTYSPTDKYITYVYTSMKVGKLMTVWSNGITKMQICIESQGKMDKRIYKRICLT